MKEIIVLENILTKEYCQELLDNSDIVYKQSNNKYDYNRNHDVATIIDNINSKIIYEKIKLYIPDTHNIVGINPHFRYLKYYKGGFFKEHIDRHWYNNNWTEVSFYSVIIYLSDNDSGYTFFKDSGLSVKPKIGTVLIFKQTIPHEGLLLTEPIKHCIRTDIMIKMKNKNTKYKN